jgi:hypothetical protein
MPAKDLRQVFAPPNLKLSNIDRRFGGRKRMLLSSPTLPGRYR